MTQSIYQIQIPHSCDWCHVEGEKFQDHRNYAQDYNEKVEDLNASLWAFQVRNLQVFQEGAWLHPLLPLVEKIAQFIQELFQIHAEIINQYRENLLSSRSALNESIHQIVSLSKEESSQSRLFERLHNAFSTVIEAVLFHELELNVAWTEEGHEILQALVKGYAKKIEGHFLEFQKIMAWRTI